MHSFSRTELICKENTVQILTKYSQYIEYLYKVVKSNSREYYVYCNKAEYSFKVRYLYRENILKQAYKARKYLDTKQLN